MKKMDLQALWKKVKHSNFDSMNGMKVCSITCESIINDLLEINEDTLKEYRQLRRIFVLDIWNIIPGSNEFNGYEY